ncbi:MAG: hypothetical protein JWM27_2284 [Gemmatimonadetes bacterium]|nr:hypothetical protein [Gemmatimonadota bacterium]
MPTPEPLDATTLRRVAEWSHSIRANTVRYLVVKPSPVGSGGFRPIELKERPDDDPENVCIPVAPPQVPGRPDLTDVDVVYPSATGPGVKRLKDAFDDFPDALFWSESAVQKFLLPYYASKLSAHGDVLKHLDVLLRAMKAPDAAVSAAVGDVLGLVHLPNSEYSAVDEGGGVGVLVQRPGVEGAPGEVVGVTLAEFARLLDSAQVPEQGVARQEGA